MHHPLLCDDTIGHNEALYKLRTRIDLPEKKVMISRIGLVFSLIMKKVVRCATSKKRLWKLCDWGLRSSPPLMKEES